MLRRDDSSREAVVLVLGIVYVCTISVVLSVGFYMVVYKLVCCVFFVFA